MTQPAFANRVAPALGYIRIRQSRGHFVCVQLASLISNYAIRQNGQALHVSVQIRYDFHAIWLCSEIHEVHALDEGEHTNGRKYEVEHCESLH